MTAKKTTKVDAAIKGAHINARRWFDRKNGNTYHSVSIRLADGTTLTNAFEYGYGEHFFCTAGQMLGLSDAYKCGHYSFREENGITYDLVDVKARKDLHNGGKN